MHSKLYEQLSCYRTSGAMRLHMPGHGGALSAFDVTELPETDDLLDPVFGGAIEADEARAARLFGARASLFSAGGATLCLQTALCFFVRRMKKTSRVYCTRRVHRSVLHAFALLDVSPSFLASVEEIYSSDASDGDLFVFGGCNYYGDVPDYAALSAFCRERGIHTVVDNAHGTHLRFLSGGELHPLKYGFGLVVDSAHKTLSCLTGAAILHVGQDLKGETEELVASLRASMRLFSSTSPSFLILLSLCEERSRIEEGFAGDNYALFVLRCEWISRVLKRANLPRIGRDPMRLVLLGRELDDGFSAGLSERGIVPEFAREGEAVFLFGENFSEEDSLKLGLALASLLPNGVSPASFARAAEAPVRALTLREALFAESETVKKDAARGRIAAEVVGLYPPGTALCMPGEILSEVVLDIWKGTHVRVVKEA